jgi:hypothetical protein
MEYFEQQLIIFKLSNTTGATCETGIILSEHLSSHLFRVGFVLLYLVFCEVFCQPLSFRPFFFCQCVDCPFSNYGLRILLWYLQVYIYMFLQNNLIQYENKEIEIYGEIMS